MHDCNYFVNQQNGEVKAIHALKSALSAYQNIDLILKKILQEKGFEAADSDCYNAFYDAIYCHNGDKECKFKHLMYSPIGDISLK